MARTVERGWFHSQTVYQDLTFEPLPLPVHKCPLPSNGACVHPTGEHEGQRRKDDEDFIARVERHARRYLEGRPFSIHSAQLKGPFDSSWSNPWIVENQNERTARHYRDASRVKEAVRAKRTAIRRHERAERAKRLQADGRGKSQELPVDLTCDANNLSLPGFLERQPGLHHQNTASVQLWRPREPVDSFARPDQHQDNADHNTHTIIDALKPPTSINVGVEGLLPTPDESENEGMVLSRPTPRVIRSNHLREETQPRAPVHHGFTPANLPALQSSNANDFTDAESFGSTFHVDVQTHKKHLPTLQELDAAVALPSTATGSRQCTECATTSSKKWRLGPHGPATLCNKCGARYYKLRMKAKSLAQPSTVPATSVQPAPPSSEIATTGACKMTFSSPQAHLLATPKPQNHRSVVKSMFPSGYDKAMLTVCPAAHILGGFARSPLTPRVNEALINLPKKASEPETKRKRLMNFDTPPAKVLGKKRSRVQAASKSVISAADGRDLEHQAVLAVRSITESVPIIGERSVDSSRSNNAGDNAAAIVSASPKAEATRHDTSMHEAESQQHVLTSGAEHDLVHAGVLRGDGNEILTEAHRNVAEEANMDASSEKIEPIKSVRYAEPLSNDPSRLDNISAPDDIASASQGDSSSSDRPEVDEDIHNAPSVYMSTQAAMLQANEAFFDGLDSPSKEDDVLSVATPRTSMHAETRTPGPMCGIISCVQTTPYLEDMNQAPVNTQDLFNAASSFDFSTGKKHEPPRMMSNFIPSQLSFRSSDSPSAAGNDSANVETPRNDIDEGQNASDAQHVCGHSGTKSTMSWSYKSAKSGLGSSPLQNAQVNVQSQTTNIDAFVDDTLTFLERSFL